MNKVKKEEQKRYQELVKNLSEYDKNNYDFLLDLQKSYKTLVDELHVKLFQEEYDYIYDSGVDFNRRRKGENLCVKSI